MKSIEQIACTYEYPEGWDKKVYTNKVYITTGKSTYSLLSLTSSPDRVDENFGVLVYTTNDHCVGNFRSNNNEKSFELAINAIKELESNN